MKMLNNRKFLKCSRSLGNTSVTEKSKGYRVQTADVVFKTKSNFCYRLFVKSPTMLNSKKPSTACQTIHF
jgi:hypothetical protein